MPYRPGPPVWAHGHPWGHPAGAGLFSLLTGLGWLVLLVVAIWLALRWLVPYLRPGIAALFGTAPAAPSAFEILRQRYAAGEIDACTFEHMWERLEASYRRAPLDALPASRASRRAAQTRRIQRSRALAESHKQAARARQSSLSAGERERRSVRAHRSAPQS